MRTLNKGMAARYQQENHVTRYPVILYRSVVPPVAHSGWVRIPLRKTSELWQFCLPRFLSGVYVRGSKRSHQSALSGRSQRVVLLEGASSSDSEPVVSGVPQGTVQGPVLFPLYINDLPDVAVHSRPTARLFADDCIVYRPIRNNDDTILLQNDLNKIAEWELIHVADAI